jgi:hypothetical protein
LLSEGFHLFVVLWGAMGWIVAAMMTGSADTDFWTLYLSPFLIGYLITVFRELCNILDHRP